MNNKILILNASYWEHFKCAKDSIFKVLCTIQEEVNKENPKEDFADKDVLFKDEIVDWIYKMQQKYSSRNYFSDILKDIAERIRSGGECKHRDTFGSSWQLLSKSNVYEDDKTDGRLPIYIKYIYRCTKCCESKVIKG